MKKIKYISLVCTFVIMFSLTLINNTYAVSEFDSNYRLDTNTLVTPVENTYQEEITKLQKEYNNQDVTSTLEIVNTDYKVPVVQGKDNSFYLKHLPNKEYSIMGSIFMDYRVNVDTSKKLLIFGHNSSSLEMPFDILENYYDKEYLDSHNRVIISTKNKVRTYELFSIYIETSDFSYMKVDFSNTSYLDHINNLKNKSMYDIPSDLNEDSNILILQTCSTHKDYLKYKKKYLILAFKEIETDNN